MEPFNLMPGNPGSLPADVLPAMCLYITAGLGLVLGALLIFWGHRAWVYRGFLVLVGAGIAWLIAPAVQGKIGDRVDINITRGVLVFALAVVGLVTARGLWAVIAAGVLALIGWLGMMAYLVPAGAHLPPMLAQPIMPAGEWFVDFWTIHLVPALHGAPGLFVAATYLTAGLIAGIVLVAAISCPKGFGVFITPLVGSALLVLSAMSLAGKFKPEWWDGAFAHKLYMLIALAVLLLAGLILQARGVQAAKRKEAEELETAEY